MSETGHRANYADWRERDALAIWQLAALMSGIDPRALSDVIGSNGDALDLSAEHETLIAGVHAGAIECGQFEHPPITLKTIIKMASALEWLRQHNHAPVATELDRTLHAPTPDRIVKKDKLIQRYRTKVWPTIEEDLKRARENGLSVAQSEAHGLWNEALALEWARQHDKLASDHNSTKVPPSNPWPVPSA
ncbi:hypothetical protein [Ottowia thiooxydans]|uniref:hypothetical protein n=1 Tax=Ottowia thiooxydans TaxID=219182 RepID=UPI000491E52C|nr:hypothetical protein [Ottowia thiooxydans]